MNLHRIRDWAETAVCNIDFYLVRSELTNRGGRLRVESGGQLQAGEMKWGVKLINSEMLPEGNERRRTNFIGVGVIPELVFSSEVGFRQNFVGAESPPKPPVSQAFMEGDARVLGF